MKKIISMILTTLLTACNGGFFEKDNTPTPFPLVAFKPEICIHQQWQINQGAGSGNDHLIFHPAVNQHTVFTANYNGEVHAADKYTGKTRWSTRTGCNLSGGASVSDHVVLVAGQAGELIALNESNGQILWRARTTSEVLANPAGSTGIALVKSIDGKLTAYSMQDGHLLWQVSQTEPTLILRGSSAPQVKGEQVVAGFANGNLINVNLLQGTEHWQQTIATPQGNFAIQRMIDVDADPIILNDRVYVATYQGKISALDLYSGRIYWEKGISSYTGIAADSEQVYVTDAKSHVWAFNARTGQINWHQAQLESRNITGPVLMGNYIVVGDQEGYLHWLCKQDGRFIARTRVNRSPILATPVVDFSQTLYVLTKNGYLATYRLG